MPLPDACCRKPRKSHPASDRQVPDESVSDYKTRNIPPIPVRPQQWFRTPYDGLLRISRSFTASQKNIVHPTTLAVHADLYPTGAQDARKCLRGKLAPLVRTEYRRGPKVNQGLFQRLYADDANVYVISKCAGERVFASVEGFLLKRMKLRINREKTAVAHYPERGFLGFSFTPGKTLKVKATEKSLDRFGDGSGR